MPGDVATGLWLALFVVVVVVLGLVQILSLFRGARNWLVRLVVLALCVAVSYYSARHSGILQPL